MPPLSGAPSYITEPKTWDVDALEYVPLEMMLQAGSVVIGAVTANAGSNLNTSLLATQATLASTLTELQSILTKLNASLAVTVATLPLPSGAATQTSLETVSTNTNHQALLRASGSVTGIGNNTVVTPAAGKKIRLNYASYNPSVAVEVSFRFGAAGPVFLRNSVSAGAVIAKDFGDFRYVEGAVDEPLVLNLSIGVATIWNALYTEQ